MNGITATQIRSQWLNQILLSKKEEKKKISFKDIYKKNNKTNLVDNI